MDEETTGSAPAPQPTLNPPSKVDAKALADGVCIVLYGTDHRLSVYLGPTGAVGFGLNGNGQAPRFANTLTLVGTYTAEDASADIEADIIATQYKMGIEPT